ncbi:caspase family protein [Iningainema tapete]|uniref:Caspase family protein n=1 Tax=Iningainema tapete BLCC-T55 TaxID=2748662 RepID=A0A8J6XJP6_9CYAN|nr:caspase family protein [Iningainema tapete]MBD2775793.1 caspase family protein [Iningainema tapete BLCC-T55]
MCPLGVATSYSTQTKQKTVAKLWLVLVGVNQYQDERLPDLRYSAVDCQGLAEALVDATAQFAQKEIKIYHDFAPQSPNLKNVRASIKQITTSAQPKDTILFYFSGHGIVEPYTQQAFLCLAETQTANLFDTGLALQELLQLLGNCPAQNQLVWLDACHSGGMTFRKETVEPALSPTPQLLAVLQQRAAKSKGFYALLSCDTDQQSWEFPELGHGVFTYYLMRGLRGEAADSQGVISADGLYKYVYHQTLQYVDKSNQQLRLINQQKISKGERELFREYSLQTPKRIVEGVGELIIGKKLDKAAQRVRRLGVVIEGISGSIALDISKCLGNSGEFELEYLQASKATVDDVKRAIARLVHEQQPETVLLYLRGRVPETEAAEELLLGENIIIKRWWLKQQLRRCKAKQIIILECLNQDLPTTTLQDWVEDLLLDSQQGQCLIACASPPEQPERFAQTLLDTLKNASIVSGLSAAGAIAQLQLANAGSGIPLQVWLSGAKGIIEILPTKTNSQTEVPMAGLDLGVCPYMGLSAFTEEDAQYFYGRENLTQQLIHQLANNSVLAVVGASGSGKSSIVQAGIIPALRLGKQIPNSEQWLIKSLRPGERPLEALAQRLAGVGGHRSRGAQEQGNRGELEFTLSQTPLLPHSPTPHLIEGILHQGVEGFVYWLRSLPHSMVVLVIDQFEELFTLAPDADREIFLELVLGAVKHASDRFKLIITLRADFIASCLEIPPLALFLQESSVLIPPRLSLDDYRRVILKPAQQVGLKVEPELVEVLLRELNQSAGDLPLLEFVLEQLWQHRQAGELTLQAYQQQLGGIKGALERSCQAVYQNLDSEARECAKWVFLSLTQLGEGTEDTRRRVFKSELIVKKYPLALVERTLKALTDAKLVVVNLEEETVEGSRGAGEAGEAGEVGEVNSSKALNSSFPLSPNPITIEVAHEILIRHWSTLRWWLEENRNRLRLQRQVEQAAMLWKYNGGQSDFLLQGVRLAEAEDIYIKYTDELSADVQQFIEACLVQRKQQQLQEKRRLRQAQRAVVALSFLGIAAFSFGGLAYWQSRASQLREIEALNASAKANLLSNQQLEALTASAKAGKQLRKVFSVPDEIKLATENVLGQAVFQTQELNRLEGHTDGVIAVSFSPDGKKIASASSDMTAKIWGDNGKLLLTLTGHSKAINSVSFAPDGKTIASASADKTIKIWSTSDGSLLRTINGHNNSVNGVSFSPDGKMIASVSTDKTIKLWSTSDAHLIRTITGHKAGLTSISFSPDGKMIASTSEDKTVRLWSSSDGRLLKTLNGHKNWVNYTTFSHDGKIIASASADKTVKLWSTEDGRLLTTLKGHTNSVFSVAFSPDDKTIASVGGDRVVKLWSRNGIELENFKGHYSTIWGVSFSPNPPGGLIATASADNTIKLWRRKDASLLEIFPKDNSRIYDVSFSPDGSAIASANGDGQIKLWRRKDGKLLRLLSGHTDYVNAVSFNPLGSTIATASDDQTVKLWNLSDGKLLYTIKEHSGEVNSISFSPNGKIIATGSRDNTIKLWRSNDGKLIKTLNGHSDEVFGVSFSHDGKMIATASADNTIKLWSVADGRLIKTITAHNNWVYDVAWSPNDQIIVSSSADKTIKLWHSRDGQLLRTLTGHTAEVYSSSFSPDGKTIASVSEDRSVKLWRLEGNLIKTLPENAAAVMSVSFSPDGKTFVSGSIDGTVKVWSFDPTDEPIASMNYLMQRACNQLHNYLYNNSKLSQNDQQICAN